MRLALASCRKLPEWEVDDRPLVAALRARGAAVDTPPWDDLSVDWSTYDGVLIRTTWDYTDRREAFVAWAETLGDRVHNPGPIVRWNTHKGYLEELAGRGVDIVPTLWIPRGSTDIPADLPWEQGFVKPAVAANAQGTLRFRRGEIAYERHALALVGAHDLMVQPYYASVETLGERSAIVVDGEVAHAVCKIPARGDYRVQDDWGATDTAHVMNDAESRLVERTLAALPPGLLYARVDWLLDDDGQPRVNEVECVEPSLFFRHGPQTAERLADAWLARLRHLG